MKIKHLLLGMLAVAATVACQQDQPVDEAKLEVSTEAVALEATAAEATFEVTSNNDWTATADADWVTLDPASGAGAAEAVTVKVTAEDNEAAEVRTATVTVKAGDLTKTVALTQAGAEPAPEPEAKLEVSTETLALEATAAEATFEVTSTNDWTATADADWVALDPASGAGAAEAVTVKVFAVGNAAAEARTATVTVKAGDLTKTVVLTQAGAEPAPEPEPTAATIASVLALGANATIPADTFVEGVVISNMDLNNLTSKKGMYIQDETAGLQFYLAANHTFKFGDKVKVDLSGAKVAAYNGAVQISGLALDKIELLSSGYDVEAKTVTIADFLANKYEVQYVAIEGVQVVDADLSKTFVMGGAHTSIKIEDADGKNFVVFSSKYATYGTTAVPQGSGTIKGISSINNGAMQIIFAQNSDYAGLTGERFGQGAVEPEPEPEPETPVAANRADFETLTRSSKYTTYTTTAGWVLTNCAVQEGHTSDVNPQFMIIGKVPGTEEWAKAACMNGHKEAVGSIESPELAGGCGVLEFDFAHLFSDKNGMDFNIEVIQNGTVVKTVNVKRTAEETAKMTKLHFSEEVNVSGTFKLRFINLCPTQKAGNADRVSIWNLSWTNVQ